MIPRTAFAFICSLAFAFAAHAHDPGLSTLQVQLTNQQLRATTVFATSDMELLRPIDINSDGKISPEELADVQKPFEELASKLLEVTFDGKLAAILETKCSVDENNNFQFDQVINQSEGSLLKITSRWPDIFPPGHRQFISYQDETGQIIAEDLLDEQHKVLEVNIAPVASNVASKTSPAFGKFFLLGIEHILTGYDHLLFLFALLIVCESFASIVKIVTCFTLAHSLTLALATFDVVQIPGEIVEPIIAASIVYVGAENIFQRGHPKGRWLLTFAFGLVHGFGFAGVLRELGIGQSGSIAVPLISFNLGVEAGQIAVAAVILPALWYLKKLPKFAPRFVPICSVVVAAAGAYWFIERVWF